jgi:hypothetical protein
MAAKSPPSTVARVRDVFPKLGQLSDDVLFGDVTLCRPEQLRGHLWRAFQERGV